MKLWKNILKYLYMLWAAGSIMIYSVLIRNFGIGGDGGYQLKNFTGIRLRNVAGQKNSSVWQRGTYPKYPN